MQLRGFFHVHNEEWILSFRSHMLARIKCGDHGVSLERLVFLGECGIHVMRKYSTRYILE